MSRHHEPMTLEQRAMRRVRIKTAFYMHALVFVLVNAGLFALNGLTGGPAWRLFPLWGWGLGLAIHGAVTFFKLNSEGLRERMLAQEMDTLRRREGH